MILVDTSVWVSFFKGEKKASSVSDLVLDNRVLLHPYVYGELLLGGMSETAGELMQSIDTVKLADYGTVVHFIKKNNLRGKGIGWVDVNIIISAILIKAVVFTFDKSLKAACKDLDCLF